LVLNLGLACGQALSALPGFRQSPRNDFVAFYTAGAMVEAGEGASLYEFAAQERRQVALLEGRPLSSGLLPFINPPHAALLFAMPARLPLGRAFTLWTLVQLAVLIGLVRWLGRGRAPLEGWLVGAALVATPATCLTLEQGALSLLMLASVLGVQRMLAARRDGAVAGWVVVGLCKPQLVLMPTLALLAGRRWRALAVVSALALALALATTAVLGHRIWGQFLAALGAVNGKPASLGLHPEDMYNLKGALWQALGPAPGFQAASVVGLAAACAATLWIWRGRWSPAEPRTELQMAATVLLGTFFSLHLYPQDGLMLVAVVLFLEGYLRRTGRSRTVVAAVGLASPALWLVTDRLFPEPPVRFPVLLQLLLGVWIFRELRRPGPQLAVDCPVPGVVANPEAPRALSK
jgi:hypothetical protein